MVASSCIPTRSSGSAAPSVGARHSLHALFPGVVGCDNGSMARALPIGPLLFVLLVSLGCSEQSRSRQILDLSGSGWRVWLDESADWEAEPLHPPGVDLTGLVAHPPSGGWDRPFEEGLPVTVPGTLEQLLWPERGDLRGVSFWVREIELPASAQGRLARLQFGAVRLVAEVTLDGHLLAYDAVGDSAFTVDLGPHARPGQRQRLAVRVTDPCGNFDWIDHTAQRFGEHTVPAGHGFGGITGDVRLEIVDRHHVADVFVRNTSDPRTVQVQVSVEGPEPCFDPVSVSILELPGGDERARATVQPPPGGWPGVAWVPVTVPAGRLWSLDEPTLHLAAASLPGGDRLEVRFGLRWFAPESQAGDALFRFNGRRIVLRSAISWGFWPLTGSVPSLELAARQVQVARELGLNMLNHHRATPHARSLDASDELGLLAHLEPGGYWAQGGDAICRALAGERWRRLVFSNRNRPSVVIHNMINEAAEPPWPGALDDLVAARLLDPSRTLTYTSAWADTDDSALGLHLRPLPSGFDDEPGARTALQSEGWHDQHEAPGPGTWRDVFYKDPAQFRLGDLPVEAIALRGEEAAIASPPRLAAMEAAYAEGLGWDGAAYLAWARGWQSDLAAMGLLERLGGLDAITLSAGRVAYDYHARSIALARAADRLDAYVINGWECEPWENHSGVVDIWRRPKGPVEVLASANADSLLVVVPRASVQHGTRRSGAGIHTPAAITVDVFVVNERNLQGDHRLVLAAVDDQGTTLATSEHEVTLSGGERYGELLLEGARLLVDRAQGALTIDGKLFVEGRSEALLGGEASVQLVDWRSLSLPTGGARVGQGSQAERFVEQVRGATLADYDPKAPAPAWVLLAGSDPEPDRPFLPGELAGAWQGQLRSGEQLLAPASFEVLDLKLTPDEPLAGVRAESWELLLENSFTPAESGPYRFRLRAATGARLWVDEQLLLDDPDEHGPAALWSSSVPLHGDRSVSVRVELIQRKDAASAALSVVPPSASAPARKLMRALLQDCAGQGTTLLVLDQAEAWARLLHDAGVLQMHGRFRMGRYWMGGGLLAAPHPLLAGLPAAGALGTPWQEFLASERNLHGLRLEGAETVVACWSDHQPRLGASLAVVQHGAGRILLSTLDLDRALDGHTSAVEVPRRLLCNMLRWAAR